MILSTFVYGLSVYDMYIGLLYVLVIIRMYSPMHMHFFVVLSIIIVSMNLPLPVPLVQAVEVQFSWVVMLV